MKDKSIVNYVNPKYLENVEVKMFRRRNSDPYKTNLTATFLHLWGPNVTVSLLIITIISITISAVGHLLSASPRDLQLLGWRRLPFTVKPRLQSGHLSISRNPILCPSGVTIWELFGHIVQPIAITTS